MATRDVVTLNETASRLEVPQTGDTYRLPRDVSVTGDATISGKISLGGNTASSTGNIKVDAIEFADGSSTTTASAVAGAGTLQDVVDAGSTANTSSDVILRNASGSQELLNVSATNGLQGMLGNIADPLVQIPFKRADDATRLSSVQTNTRASTATYYDSLDGLPKTAAIDEVRFQRALNGTVMMLREASSTNLITYSDLTLANTPLKSGTLTDNALSLGILTNGVHMAGGVTDYAYFSLNVPAVDHVVSVFVVMDDGLAPVLGVTTSSGDLSLVMNGTLLTGTPKYTHVRGSLYRVELTGVGSAALEDVGAIKYSTQSSRGLTIVGLQVEAGKVALSYIPTSGTALTRAADVNYIQASGNFVNGSYTVFIDIEPTDVSITAGELWRANGATTLDCYISLGILYARNGAVGSVNTVINSGLLRIGNRFDSTTNTLYLIVNGEVVASKVMLAPNTITQTTIAIGSYGTAGVSQALSGLFSNFRVYDKALTDQEIGAA